MPTIVIDNKVPRYILNKYNITKKMNTADISKHIDPKILKSIIISIKVTC